MAAKRIVFRGCSTELEYVFRDWAPSLHERLIYFFSLPERPILSRSATHEQLGVLCITPRVIGFASLLTTQATRLMGVDVDGRLEQKISDVFLNLSLIACPMSRLPLPLKTRKCLDILTLNRVFISLVS
jgi:hypothetical protein